MNKIHPGVVDGIIATASVGIALTVCAVAPWYVAAAAVAGAYAYMIGQALVRKLMRDRRRRRRCCCTCAWFAGQEHFCHKIDTRGAGGWYGSGASYMHPSVDNVNYECRYYCKADAPNDGVCSNSAWCKSRKRCRRGR